MRDRPREFIVYGAGGFGREVAWLIERSGDRVEAFADDHAIAGRTLRSRPVLRLEEAVTQFPRGLVVIPVADARARETMAARVATLGCYCPSVIDPATEIDRATLSVGAGAIVCARTVITTDVTIGRFVHVNLGCTIGHDAVLEDFVTLAPGVHISGNVHVLRGAYLGTGATVIHGRPGAPLIIGAGAIVGAQTCVIRDVPAQVTAVGVPARALPGHPLALHALPHALPATPTGLHTPRASRSSR